MLDPPGVQGPEWEAWRPASRCPVITPDNHPWLKKVAGYIAAGRRVYDVHIVEWRLAEYTRYGLAHPNGDVGWLGVLPGRHGRPP